ncbi:class I SAM-dependent methyltransferase [Aliarcobacter skirrowii]|uniref:class I SAM-dependent methyltransferase n=1 Tax=Aliarcobacter skirrowii TaxID=28200 RepID=UPI0008333FB6|nr:class I SAM-dependent methyltransferase [Aliarcobacter skirrowii]
MDKIQQLQDSEYNLPYHHISRFRDGFSQTFNDTWGINYVATIEFLLNKLKQENFSSIVDIGCGDGRLTLELHREFRNKSKVIGIDYSRKAIRQARAVVDTDLFKCIDITKEKLDEKFDIALLVEVFEHINPLFANEFINGVANQIKDDGLLFVTVPHINKPVEYKHYRHFSIELITECFKNHFDLIEIIPFERISKRKKFIDIILTNKYFILNHQKMKNILYKYYKEKLFFVKNEHECQRLFIKFKKKTK